MSRTNEDTRTPQGNFRGKHTGNQGYQAMNHWVVCDSCGFDIRAEDIRETWDHRLVCPADWEPRHPQDFVRSKQEDMSAKGPVRPDPEPIYILRECADDALAGIAIASIAVCGNGSGNDVCRSILPPIPGGTFNTNTL